LLKFGGAPVSDTDSRSLFRFQHRCGIFRDLLPFIMQSLADFYEY